MRLATACFSPCWQNFFTGGDKNLRDFHLFSIFFARRKDQRNLAPESNRTTFHPTQHRNFFDRLEALNFLFLQALEIVFMSLAKLENTKKLNTFHNFGFK